MTVGSQARVVFVSYAHEDVAIRERLEIVLKPLVRIGRLELWADARIGVGRSWSDDIEHNLGRAELAVLLVSADFLASDYVIDVELPRLLERGVRLVCVPVGPCGWHVCPELASVQWALNPELPLSAMTPNDRESALMSVFNVLVSLARELDVPDVPEPGRAAPRPRAAAPLLRSAPGDLFGVPELPRFYRPRDAELTALTALLGSADAGLVGQRANAGLEGRGGVGKSVLAAAACRDERVREWFPDGVFWMTLGESPDVVGRQRELAAQLGETLTTTAADEGARELRRLLGQRRALVVVDDVWSSAAAEAFAVGGPSGRVLYTTRDASILRHVGADALTVDVLSAEAATEFLRQAAEPGASDEPALVEQAIAETGTSILALSLVAAVVRGGRGWAYVTGQLRSLARVFRDHPYADVFKSMRLAVLTLDPADADRYRLLGVFPEDTTVPQQTIARLWDVDDAGPTLAALAAAGLLAFDGEGVGFHDLQRAFVLFDAEGPRALGHRRLLDAHRPAAGWSRLPDDDAYLWDHLLYHLELAGHYDEMTRVVTDGRWLARRLHRSGARAAERDALSAANAVTDDRGVSAVLRLLRRWPGLFAGELGLTATAATLISRLAEARDACADLLAPAWLEPMQPLAEPPSTLRRTLAGHQEFVTDLAFSRDGRTLATASYDHTVRLWDVAEGTARHVLTGHSDGVDGIAFSPDDRLVASASKDGTARVWDARSGAAVHVLEHADDYGLSWVTAIAYAADGTLGTVSWRGPIRLWSRSETLLRELNASDEMITTLAFSPDCCTLAAGAADGTVRLWRVGDGVELRVLGHGVRVGHVAFAPGGDVLASVGGADGLRLWNPHDGGKRPPPGDNAVGVKTFAFSADGEILVTASEDGSVRLWDLATGAQLATRLGHIPGVLRMALAQDARTLATSGDRSVQLWDLAADAEAHALGGAAHDMSAVALSPDRDTLAAVGADGSVALHDAATGERRRTLVGGDRGVSTIGWARDSAAVTTVASNGCVRERNLAGSDDGPFTVSDAVADGYVFASALSPDTSSLARATFRKVVVYRLPGGSPSRSIPVDVSAFALAFTPDGRTIAAGCRDGSVHLFDVRKGTLLHATAAGGTPIQATVFAPDGGILATSDDQGIRLWRASDAEELGHFATGTDRCRALAFAPDGRSIATADEKGTVRLWDLDGTEIAAIRLGNTANDVTFARDAATLAACVDRELVLLRLRTTGR